MHLRYLLIILLLFTACEKNSATINGRLDLEPQSDVIHGDIKVWPAAEIEMSPKESPANIAEITLKNTFAEIMEKRRMCGHEPYACDVAELAQPGSPLFVKLVALMRERSEAHITASNKGTIRYRINNVRIKSAAEALVTTCLTDDTVLVDGEIVFDDSMYSERTEWTLVFDGGRWRWFSAQARQWTIEEDLCGFTN